MKKTIVLILVVLFAIVTFVSCSSSVKKWQVTLKCDGQTKELYVNHGNKLNKDYVRELFNLTEDQNFWKVEGEGKFWDFNTPVTHDMVLTQEGCIAEGTLITMADGSHKKVEDIKEGDYIKTFDHETGCVSTAQVYYLGFYEKAFGAFTLVFSNNIEVTLIQEHGLFDKDLNKYVYITENNAEQFIGHHFYNMDKDCFEELIAVKKEYRPLDAYYIITEKHMNHSANGMLAMGEGIVSPLANVFVFDENMKFDEAKKSRDIKKYGLYNWSDFPNYSEKEFYAYNIAYFKIAIGKGFISQETVETILPILSAIE